MRLNYSAVLMLAFVGLALAWPRQRTIPAGVRGPAYLVPQVDSIQIRRAADTVHSEMGVVFDPIVWARDSLLHLHLKRGTFTRGCAGAGDAYPASQHLAVQMFDVYARERPTIRGIVVQTQADSVLEQSWLGRTTCRTSGSTYYYRSTLDSLVRRIDPHS